MRIKSKISLIGGGGMASEIGSLFYNKCYIEHFYDEYKEGLMIVDNIKSSNLYNIAVGYPETKIQIIKNIKNDVKWNNPLIHEKSIRGVSVNVGLGSVVYPFVILTADIRIGTLATINGHVKIGHDCVIGEMFHASPGATVSGYVTIGDRVFLGANSVVKEYVKICDDVIIGAGAVVIKDITEPGKYAGVPARKI